MKLSARKTKYRTLRVITENIDQEIALSKGGFINPTLGQAQDVRPWISSPELVDWRIKGNLERFASLLPVAPRVLDVGCYGGYAFDWLRQKSPSIDYLGVDIEPGYVKDAAESHKHLAGAKFTAGNALDLNSHFRDKHGDFDAALCLRLVIHLPFLEAVLAGLMRMAPLALVGLRISSADRAVERLDEVSGQRHFYRWFSEATIRRSIPTGCKPEIYRDGSYDSLVVRRGE